MKILASNKLNKLVFIMLVIGSTACFADINRWSTSGPTDARVVTIAIYPQDNQRLYIGTIEDGIYQSINSGNNWFHMENDSLAPTSRIITIHPNGPDTMFAGTTGGFLKSTDAGTSWHRPLSGWSGNETRDIEFHPTDPSIIFAVGNWLQRKSIDGGENWINLDLPSLSIMAIRFNPQYPDTMYLATQSGIYGLSVYKSNDGGDSWYSVHNNLDSELCVWDMAIDHVDPRILYVGGHNLGISDNKCIAKTVDGGRHWFDISPDGLRIPMVSSIAISPLNHNILFAGTIADGIFKSTDGGANWQQVNDGIKTRIIATLTIDSTTGNIYIGTYYDGIYRSTNDGNNWLKIGQGIYQASCMDISVNMRSPESVYVATANGLYRSIDAAQSWQYVDINYPYEDAFTSSVKVDPINPNYIYLTHYSSWDYGSACIFRSTNAGISWNEFHDGLPTNAELAMLKVGFQDDADRKLFLATSSGLYTSTNLGENWNHINGGLPPDAYIMAIDISKVDHNIIFIGDYDGNLFKSIDNGDSWSSLTIPTGSLGVTDITCDPLYIGTLYACESGLGIFKSINGGTDWLNVTNNLPHNSFFLITGLAINPLNHDNLFVNSYYCGFFESNNGGESWHGLSDSLPPHYIGRATLIDPTDTCHIYLASSTCSVWSITRSTDGIDDNGDLPQTISLSPNYPNPFNSSTTLRYGLPAQSSATIDIYDILGRKMQTLAEGIKPAGNYQVIWQARDIPSGVYFYKLTAGEFSQTRKMILVK